MRITEETMRQEAAQRSGQAPEEVPAAPKAPELSEREKLKNMTPKDRVWYIWNYYKFHMLAVAVALVIIHVIATSVYRSTFSTALHCISIDSYSASDVNFTPLEEDFSSWLGLSEKELITTEVLSMRYGEDADEYSMANMAKMSAMVASRDLDVTICNTESIDHYASLSGYLDLETALPADILALVQDRLYYTTGEDGVSHAYAIDLSGTAFAAECSLSQGQPLFGIISSTTRIDNVLALIRYIFES